MRAEATAAVGAVRAVRAAEMTETWGYSLVATSDEGRNDALKNSQSAQRQGQICIIASLACRGRRKGKTSPNLQAKLSTRIDIFHIAEHE